MYAEFQLREDPIVRSFSDSVKIKDGAGIASISCVLAALLFCSRYLAIQVWQDNLPNHILVLLLDRF